MTHLELFVNHALEYSNISAILPYIQKSFNTYHLAVLEVIWDTFPNGKYFVRRVETRDPEAFRKFPGNVPERKFLVFEEFPTKEIFIGIINRDLVKWIVDVNFQDVEVYPTWQIPEYA